METESRRDRGSRKGLMVTTKITVLGPAPFGGTLSAPLTDPSVDKAIADGGSVLRIWNVYDVGVGSPTVEVLFDARVPA